MDARASLSRSQGRENASATTNVTRNSGGSGQATAYAVAVPPGTTERVKTALTVWAMRQPAPWARVAPGAFCLLIEFVVDQGDKLGALPVTSAQKPVTADKRFRFLPASPHPKHPKHLR